MKWSNGVPRSDVGGHGVSTGREPGEGDVTGRGRWERAGPESEAPWRVMSAWGPVKPGQEKRPSFEGPDGPTRSGLKCNRTPD